MFGIIAVVAVSANAPTLSIALEPTETNTVTGFIVALRNMALPVPVAVQTSWLAHALNTRTNGVHAGIPDGTAVNVAEEFAGIVNE